MSLLICILSSQICLSGMIWKISLRNIRVKRFSRKTIYLGRFNKCYWIESNLGNGSGATSSILSSANLSARNFYLQTAFQVRFLGITILFLLFLSIWNYLYFAKRSKKVRIIGSLFLGFLMFLVFEVYLTQNNLATGLL